MAEVHVGDDRHVFTPELGKNAADLAVELLRHLRRVLHRTSEQEPRDSFQNSLGAVVAKPIADQVRRRFFAGFGEEDGAVPELVGNPPKRSLQKFEYVQATPTSLPVTRDLP
jgi:hypothetical protein